MSLKVGNDNISDIYVGNDKIGKIYVGNDLVYESIKLPIFTVLDMTGTGVGNAVYQYEEDMDFNDWSRSVYNVDGYTVICSRRINNVSYYLYFKLGNSYYRISRYSGIKDYSIYYLGNNL